MRVAVKGTNMRVPRAVREYADKRISKLSRYATFVRQGSLVLTAQRSWLIAEITLTLGDTVLRAEEKSNDAYVSIDLAAEKIEAQLHRLKGRMLTRKREARAAGTSDREAEELLAQLGEEDEGVEELSDGKLVRTKTFPIKPMTTEEAILQMELLGHDFFVFYQAEDGRPAVVYARNDGNYGLLVPEPL